MNIFYFYLKCTIIFQIFIFKVIFKPVICCSITKKQNLKNYLKNYINKVLRKNFVLKHLVIYLEFLKFYINFEICRETLMSCHNAMFKSFVIISHVGAIVFI